MRNLIKDRLDIREISANDIRKDMCIFENGQGYKVLGTDWTKPGKGGAFINTELKSFDNEKKYIRFKSTQKVFKINLREEKCVYLYRDMENIYCNSLDGLEYFDLPLNFIDKIYYLVENLHLTIIVSGETQIRLDLPKHVALKVKSVGAFQKKQTITNSLKTAILENDLEIGVPQFINTNDRILVRTEDDTYIERYKGE